MTSQDTSALWSSFQAINSRRRAIRDFDGTPIPDEDVRAILNAAIQAPSSSNLQPYQFHWVRDPKVKAQLAEDCNGQRGAQSSSTRIVVAASPMIARNTAQQLLKHLDNARDVAEKSKGFQRNVLGTFLRVLSVGSWPVWTPITALVTLFKPSLSLLPLGHMGSRGWAARNSNFAAQTLMLAAAAKGIDSGPMEGFSAPKVAKTLRLERGTVIPVVIALGYRTRDAMIDPQWRRPPQDVIVEH